ncbi:MAG TPA: hypothetical protein VMD79_16300 [Solirubrobacteraceae bacterium]|nr:hypothetical protein [Solirubrobacteraceae bacterium]
MPMTSRLARAWRAMRPEQRLVALAALGLLGTMFLPWYQLQSLDRKTGAIYSHSINAFGDVSFVEAAIFVVAVGVGAIVFARADGREFHLPGGDGLIVMLAGCWAGLLIFYRVFSRPAGDGYPVGIQWGFFLAFVAAGGLALAGWRMRAAERPEPPLTRRARRARRPPAPDADVTDITVRAAAPARPRQSTPVPAERAAAGRRPRYPPAPASSEPEQLSFEDPSTHAE